MWRFKYLVCLVTCHNWAGSNYRYCLRCGKLELSVGYSMIPLLARANSSEALGYPSHLLREPCINSELRVYGTKGDYIRKGRQRL
jgi:hypothetical protein